MKHYYQIGDVVEDLNGELLQIVAIEELDTVTQYELKWFMFGGELSNGSLFVYGSQIASYKIYVRGRFIPA